jgi:hypothetical protein
MEDLINIPLQEIPDRLEELKSFSAKYTMEVVGEI